MFRTLIVLTFLFAASALRGLSQTTVEDQWKGLVMQALYSAGANDFAKAEETFLRALHEAERFGGGDPRVGTTLNSLGLVYRAEKKYADAENVYRRSLAILDKAYGSSSIDVANVNFNIAAVMFDQGHQQSALPYIQKAMVAYQSLLGGNSMKTGDVLCMLGDAYRLMKSYPEAEGPLRRCAEIREQDGGLQSPALAATQHSLALVLQGQGKLTQAESRYKLAERIRENTLGITSPELAQVFQDHASLLRQMGRDKEAEKLIALAAAIRRNQSK